MTGRACDCREGVGAWRGESEVWVLDRIYRRGDRISGEDPAQMREEVAHEAGFILSLQFVLPDAEDAPAAGAKGARHEAITGLVAGDFFAPELRVLLGFRAVERTAVVEQHRRSHG